ncbi:glycosyltransferase [Kamptonema cortianum]|nr:glycosyltransferase [Kamptonema cortianum]
MSATPPLLLDCTRMLARHWSGANPTGIDRVADAYRKHFATRALATIQLRGRHRVLSKGQSERLFAILDAPIDTLRQRFAGLGRGLAAVMGTEGPSFTPPAGSLYLNVTHTNFDLERHLSWVRSRNFRPVYLLHDLIPIEHPQFTTPHKFARHRGRVRGALEAACGIIANSHATARDIATFARIEGLAMPPILGAPLGTPHLPQPPARHAPPHPTFVYVSTIEQRKNHMLLLDVWQRLIARHGERAPRLMLIGRWGIGSRLVRQRYLNDPLLRRFISIRTNCSDAEVAEQLTSARALLAPSHAEGFGLPVAEALALGVPVIASDLPAFREVGGNVPTFLAPKAPEAWLRAIEGFMTDGPERRRQLLALAEWSAPDWRDHFALVEDWLHTLPARSPRTLSHLHADNDTIGRPPISAGGIA